MNENNIYYPDSRRFCYPVIKNVKGSALPKIRQNLEYLLDIWPVFESTGAGFMDCIIPVAFAARIGVPDRQAKRRHSISPCLTLRQLFAAWRQGKLVHPAFYDGNGNIVHENVYQAGITVTSQDSYQIWAVIPSRKTTLIAERPGIMEIADIDANIQTYFNACFDELVAGENGNVN